MIRPVLLLWLAAVCPLAAQQKAEVEQGPFKYKVRTAGTVMENGIFRLKATIEGRADRVWSATGTWAGPGKNLAVLLNREFAALQDAHASTDQNVLEDRWKPVYQPSPVRCPRECFILRSFVTSGQWVKPRTLLFEAAAHLRMVGRVRPEDAPYIENGQTLEFWAADKPAQHYQTLIGNYSLDTADGKTSSGGSFHMDMPPALFLPPRTRWEGIIIPYQNPNALLVPTSALLNFDDGIYLPVLVSTGMTSEGRTEIISGVDAGRGILVLPSERLGGAQRYKKAVDAEALRRRLERDSRAEPEPAPQFTRDAEPAPPRRRRPADMGEDPYAE